VGGHSVDDEEPKYGLCVSGVVHPHRIITNAGARPGDALILTKPIGSGVLFNAVRSGKYPYSELERDTLPSIAALNSSSMQDALKFDLHACTDLTGFGILGHLLEMANGADARIIVDYSQLAFYPGALEMYQKGETTGSNQPNRAMVAKHNLEMQRPLTPAEEELLYDPQTSGGLLLALPAAQADELLIALRKNGVTQAMWIAEITAEPVSITVV
jgi:selenide,water dikinase